MMTHWASQRRLAFAAHKAAAVHLRRPGSSVAFARHRWDSWRV